MGNKCFIKELLIHIINTNDKLATPTQLMKFKYIIHNIDTNEQYLLNYFFNEMRLLDNV